MLEINSKPKLVNNKCQNRYQNQIMKFIKNSHVKSLDCVRKTKGYHQIINKVIKINQKESQQTMKESIGSQIKQNRPMGRPMVEKVPPNKETLVRFAAKGHSME